MNIVITWYKDWMKDQVISMFEGEYHVQKEAFEKLFSRFYFHPYQKNKCLLIVALDGETVAGFQSFFYWPYRYRETLYNSFQSGNSLVNPNYRGKGIFQKMLAFIAQENKTIGIDFLMGFPVEASFKNFMKDKWQNILNLNWYVKLCNPLGFLNTGLHRIKGIMPGCVYFSSGAGSNETLRLNADKNFTDWQENYMSPATYHSFTFEKDDNTLIFHLKKNRRKKIFNELVIGNILFSSPAAVNLLEEALGALNARARNSCSFHFVSLALNDKAASGVTQHCLTAGFKKTGKSIYFIVKPFAQDAPVTDARNWELYRSDIDTW